MPKDFNRSGKRHSVAGQSLGSSFINDLKKVRLGALKEIEIETQKEDEPEAPKETIETIQSNAIVHKTVKRRNSAENSAVSSSELFY